ncbi:WD40 repeat containing protein [Gracilaria domingensis]|nr:WD40 repeat containing protein [Gracilaria domingensis]
MRASYRALMRSDSLSGASGQVAAPRHATGARKDEAGAIAQPGEIENGRLVGGEKGPGGVSHGRVNLPDAHGAVPGGGGQQRVGAGREAQTGDGVIWRIRQQVAVVWVCWRVGDKGAHGLCRGCAWPGVTSTATREREQKRA